ncbi:MAG: transpeptidase family protein [Geobacter sp.]|nr:transpeptidase family protein [Geobacter sp.]
MKDRRETWAKRRIYTVGAFFAVFFTVVSARAFYLQIVKHEDWVKLAERQHQKTVALTPARGAIYDAHGEPLAVSIEMDSCYAEPRNIEEMEDTVASLAPLLGINRDELVRKLSASRNFVWLQRRMSPEQAKKIKGLKMDGIGFVKETKRFYPNSETAAHVVGFTGMDPEGLEGIELKYDDLIVGNTGYLVTERDALGRSVGQAIVKQSSQGGDITLTLDKNIQYIAEKELGKAVLASGAKGGMALVMEPRTGKVLALANYPNFNPNSYSQYSPWVLRNRLVADSFEPGSTFKTFLVAAALEEKIVSPGDSFNCENGSYSIGGRVIHDTHKYSRLSVADILKYSSNIGAAKIGMRLGRDKLYGYLKNFGFAERSGIDLPGEAIGYLRDKSQWFGVDLSTISFGQGVSVSAVQLTAAMSAIANGGVLMKPYLVEKVTDSNGAVIRRFEPHQVRRVISPETATSVGRMMEGVTTEGGTGMNASVDGYRVAGKTGTAQKVDPVTKGYSVDKRTASFLGFLPVDDPRLTIMVIIDEPKTSPYGGVVAAPAFSAIAQQSLCYLHVPPAKGVRPPVPRTIEVRKETPQEMQAMVAEGTITDGNEGAMMPNFSGMSMRQVLRVMEKRGINVKLLGSGRVVEQFPRAGDRIRPTDQVMVKFAPSA